MAGRIFRPTGWLLGLAAAFVALLLGTALIEPYGLFHDELYYWAGARRLGLGYVDHPPLAAWVLSGSLALLGESTLGFALVPALCAAGTTLLTGEMARRFGASSFGQGLAGLCVLVAPLYQAFFSFYSVNALEFFFWTAACFCVAELIRSGDERLWLCLGLVAGIALLNKHTFALLGFGLGVGVLATPLRAHLRSRWLWIGIGIAVLLALPNVYWNAAHDWPSLTFYRSVGTEKNIPTSPAEAIVFQIVGMNPVAALVWLPGLAFLLFSRAARPYRPLGIAFLALLVVIVFSGLRRGDRIAGAYPIVFAAGGAFWDQWARRPWQRRVRWLVPALLGVVGVIGLPAALPVLAPERVENYFEALGVEPQVEPGDAGKKIPLHLLGRLEWKRVANDVVTAWQTLPPDQQARAVVLAPHWLYASVVEFYGRDRGLPPVVSPHNAYYFWRREAAGRDIALSIDIEPAVLDRYFEKTRVVGMFHCEHCAHFRADMTIAVSTGPKRPIEEMLGEWRHFGSTPSPHLRP